MTNIEGLATLDLTAVLSDTPLRTRLFQAIETQLSEHELVRSCAVILDHRASQKAITVFYTAYANRKINSDTLYAYLREHIPGYHFPTYFLQVQALPMDSDGGLMLDDLPIPLDDNLIQLELDSSQQQQTLPAGWKEASDIHQELLEASIRQAEAKFATKAIHYESPESGDMGPGAQANQHPILAESPLHTGDATRINSMPTNTEQGRNELSNRLTHQNQQKLTNSNAPRPSPNPV